MHWSIDEPRHEELAICMDPGVYRYGGFGCGVYVKTLKEVVDEVGYPVYVAGVNIFGRDFEAIVVYEGSDTLYCGQYLHGGVDGGSGSALTTASFKNHISFYQSLKDEPAKEYGIKVVQDFRCTCVTLLNGHHEGCQWNK